MNSAAADPVGRFTALYEATYGRIHAYAARRVGVEAADEVAAETFLVAWRRMDVLPDEPLPWLYGIARNIVARQHRATGRRRSTEAALARERGEHQGELGETDDPALWDAWAQLRPADREVLSLVAWEELTVSEGARVVGCPAAVFSVRLHRARRRLERLLSEASPQPIPATGLSNA